MILRLASLHNALFHGLFPAKFSHVSRLHSANKSGYVINSVKYSSFTPSSLLKQFNKRKSLLYFGSGGCILAGLGLGFTLKTAHCDSIALPANDFSASNELNNSASTASSSSGQVNWRIFFSFLRTEFHYLLGAIVSALIVSVLNIKIPLLLGDIVNAITGMHSQETIVSMSAFLEGLQKPLIRLLGAYILQGFFTFSYISLLSNMGENVATNMRKMMFAYLLSEDVEFYDRHKCGDLLSHLSSDVQDFKSSFKMCVSQGLRSITQIIGSAGALFYLSYEMTTIMFIIIPALVGIGSIAGTQLRKRSRKAQAQNSKANDVAEEALGNIRTVKSFAMEVKEFENYSTEVDKANNELKALGMRIGLFQGFSNIGLNGLILTTLSCGGYFIVSHQMNEGNLMAFLVASQTIQRSLGQISQLFGQVVRGYAALQRVLEYIPMEYNSVNMKRLLYGENMESSLFCLSDEELSERRLSLEFKNVNFVYPTRPDKVVLKDFTLTLPPGKIVALCGKSGSGKSTIVSLLERFYEPTSGAILLNGRPLHEYNCRWLRQHFLGLISQEPQLFNVSVRENIRFGKPSATDEEVENAALSANAVEFIQTAFPEGYDTIVGERGAAISGGQKQRIAIARALLKNPAVLILDEATSALDNASESIVQQTLDKVMKGRTVLVIAHRLSTIQNADLIVVLHEGRIVEQGTHTQLMKAKGHYWQLLQKNEFRK